MSSSSITIRIKRLQDFLPFGHAALIASQEGIYYYTGIYSDEFIVLITHNKTFICADKRSFESIPHVMHSVYMAILLDFKAKNEIARIVAVDAVKTIIFEPSIQYIKLKRLKKLFTKMRFREKLFHVEQLSRLENAKNVPRRTFFIDELQQLRRIKDKDEIKIMKKSLNIAEAVMQIIRKKLKEGVSEVEIVFEIHKIALTFGCAELSFPPIVAFGRNSAIPHHLSTYKRLRLGEIALIDLGVKWKGYCSDITRTFFTGTPPNSIVKNYTYVCSAIEKAFTSLQSGIRADKIYALVHKSFHERGVSELFTHAAGHGIGLNIHESPGFSPKDKHKLYENEIMTIEPGLYSQNWGGIRLENMVIIQASKAFVLNHLPLDLDFAILKHM